MRSKPIIGGLALASVLLFAACGGGSTKSTASTSNSTSSSSGKSDVTSLSSGGGGSISACKLSASDVKAIVGYEVKQDGTGDTCTYKSLDGDNDHIGSSVSFSVASSPGGAALQQSIVDGIASALKVTPTEVPGLGDRAFAIDLGVGSEVVTFKGDTYVIVAVADISGDAATLRDQAVALTKKLLA